MKRLKKIAKIYNRIQLLTEYKKEFKMLIDKGYKPKYTVINVKVKEATTI